jgi:5-methylcytosine-specific restriction protein A
MSRAVKEWIAKNDDQAIPRRVKVRVFKRDDGRCKICTTPVEGKLPQYDHVIALANGGLHRETNLQLLCKPCHAEKTKADVAEKSKVYHKTAKDIGVKLRKGRPMPGTRDSGIKRPFFGPVINRRTGKPFSSRSSVERQT